MEIIWLPLAENALDEIFRFYEKKSLIVAGKMIADILTATARLSKFPHLAAREQSVQHSSYEFRALVVRHHYKVVYFVSNGKIYIADVWDCRQDPDILTNRINPQK